MTEQEKNTMNNISNRIEEKANFTNYIKTLCTYQNNLLEELRNEIDKFKLNEVAKNHLNSLIGDINTFNLMIEEFARQTTDELNKIYIDIPC